jgi:hypothetical protein
MNIENDGKLGWLEPLWAFFREARIFPACLGFISLAALRTRFKTRAFLFRILL